MSYNLDMFKIKELAEFHVPLRQLLELNQWMEAKYRGDGQITVTGYSEGFELSGKIVHKDDREFIQVESMDLHGEGSGTLWSDLTERIFPDSTGRMVVSQIWEGGDTVCKATIDNGTFEEVDIEL